MITTCTHCQARYQLEEDKVPRRMIKVRCPACQGVFNLDGAQAAAVVDPMPAAPAQPAAPVQEPLVSSGFGDSFAASTPPVADTAVQESASPEPEAAPDPGIQTGFSDPFASPETPAPSVSAPAASVASAQETAGEDLQAPVAVLDESAPGAGRKRRRRSKEEMMARALVSDILVYNRDARDTALAEGNLLEALGAEIKKSWELYKEKVTPEVANSTNHFRDALNEILADGEKVF